MKRILAGLGICLLVVLALLVLVNWNSVDDGIRFLYAMATYAPPPPDPLDARGKFGFCEQFVSLRNAQRAQFIANFLDARQIAYLRLPIGETKFDNFFVPFAPRGPYTIFSAHYDKALDDPEYQGASDNSAADCMLLVAAAELNQQKLNRPVAILFTGEEEVGLIGAKAFYDYATQNDVRVADVVNFDNIGRAGLAARASGDRSGFVFTLPLLGEFVYDGRQLAPASPYRQPDARLLERLRRVAPIAYYDRMVAKSDATYWQDAGWDALTLTSDDMYFQDQTWHTYADRVELLQQSSFERALELVLGYAQREQ
jgi:hypothetical protein